MAIGMKNLVDHKSVFSCSAVFIPAGKPPLAEKGADASMDLQNGHFPGKEAIKNLLAFLKWSALALFAGIVIGLIGTAFTMP